MRTAVTALTVPARWARDGARWLLRSPAARRRDRTRRSGGWWEQLFPDDPGFSSGVREPRRPKPTPPADAVSLDVPQE